MDFVASVQNLFYFYTFLQFIYIFVKGFLVSFNFFRSLCANMGDNTCNILSWVKLQWLNKLLEIASVPINETTHHQSFLFNLVFFWKFNMLYSLKVATVLCVDFFFDQLLKSIWFWEESEVLYNLDLFLFRFFTDTYISSLENFWAQISFTKIFLSFVSSTSAHCGIFSNHLSY